MEFFNHLDGGWTLRYLIPVIILASFTFGSGAIAQDDETWRHQWDAAAAAQRQHKIPEAEQLAKTALNSAEKLAPHSVPNSELVKSIALLASIFEEQGKYGESEPLRKRALQLWQDNQGVDSIAVGTGSVKLAEVYRKQLKYAEAEPLYIRALAIWNKSATPINQAAVLETMQHLHEVLVAQHKNSKADKILLPLLLKEL